MSSFLDDYSEEDLFNYIKRSPGVSISIAKVILANKNCNEEVLTTLASKVDDEDMLISILKHPNCSNRTCLAAIKRIEDYGFTSNKFLDEFFSLANLSYEDIDKIFESDYDYKIYRALIRTGIVPEESILKFLENKRIYNDDLMNEIVDSPKVTPMILKKILSFKVSTKLLVKLSKHPKLNETGQIKVLNTCLKGVGGGYASYDTDYYKVVDEVLASDMITPFDVSVAVRTIDKNTDDEVIDAFMKSPKLDEDSLRELRVTKPFISVKKYLVNPNTPPEILEECAKELSVLSTVIKHPNANESVIKKALDYAAAHMEGMPTFKYLLIDIARLPQVSSDILIDVVKNSNGFSSRSYTDEILNAVSENPNADKSVKIAVVANSGNVSIDSIKKTVESDDIDSNDLISLFKALPKYALTNEILNYLIESDKATPELHNAMVIRLYEEGKMNHDIFLQLAKKELSESTLVYIIKNDSNANHILHAINLPNAGLKVVAAANTACDQFKDSTRDSLAHSAAKLKKRIIESIYHVEEEKNVTDILRRNVERRMSTMLWGPSGVGKSARVFEVDPTATMLILKGSMLPEEVVGGKEPNGEPGKIYPPHWYTVLKEKCEKEPDRMHILFIDEFTNVKDNIKNLVWEVIGNRTVNGHEEWTLPDNCAVVVAGNRPEESTAVTIDTAGGVMPAPLHNRIDSMLEIPFDLEEWQKWALETNPQTGKLRIHPIVYSFCVAHADKVMFSEFNPEAITKPFLTPRKWERLSDAIYACEKDDPLRHLGPITLASIIGDGEIGRAFQEHYDRLPMDMDKITYGKYTEEDFPSIEDKLYALGMVIAKYDGDEEAAKDFVATCLGDEYSSIYETMSSARKAVLNTNKGKSK